MFAQVMRDTKYLKPLLEYILRIKISTIRLLEPQKSEKQGYNSKGVRLDLYVEDDEGSIYNVEVQTYTEEQLPKRMRYYQSILDISILNPGHDYSELRKSFVIFICNYDPFERDRIIYTFENVCREEPDLVFGDDTYKIVLNTKGRKGEISDELREIIICLDEEKMTGTWIVTKQLAILTGLIEKKECFMSFHDRTKRIILLALSLAVFGAAALTGPAGAEALLQPAETWESIRQAYIFSFPLMLMDATKTVSTNTVEPTNGKAPVNQWMHAKTLAGANFRQVVTPNVDTLYSQIFFDLSQEPLVLHKPSADRYLMYQVMDAWSDTVAVLGTGGDGQDEHTYLFTGPAFAGEIPEGMIQVKIPTSIGWLLGRTVCYGPDDLENIYEIQSRMDAKPLSVYLNGGTIPEGVYDAANDGVPIRMVFAMGPQAYFSRFNQLLADNPVYPEDEALLASFAALGIGPGLSFDASILGENAADRWKTMLTDLLDELTLSAGHFMIQNGSFRFWGYPISRFGTEYDYRCLVAIAGFGANPVEVAVYMRGVSDENGNELSGDKQYVLHFEADKLPPVKENGFWSVTAYGDDDFLIENELDRYSISDRSSFKLNPDGSLDLYLQAEAPAENTENWLPVGKEGFHLFMRIYQPAESVLDGTWKAPSIIEK